VLVLSPEPEYTDVKVTYWRTEVIVVVLYTVMVVLSRVGAFDIVMGVSNGEPLKIVLVVMGMKTSTG
jgi:hypothetical protein